MVALAGDTSTCNTSNRWSTILTITAAWAAGGEVMSKRFSTTTVSPTGTPFSVLKFGPGPYSTIQSMFSFPGTADGWDYSGSTVFGIQVLSGTSYGNGMWWDWGGTAARKANYCIGTSPNHQTCLYDGGTAHGQCGNLHNSSGSWSAGGAQELYVREP